MVWTFPKFPLTSQWKHSRNQIYFNHKQLSSQLDRFYYKKKIESSSSKKLRYDIIDTQTTEHNPHTHTSNTTTPSRSEPEHQYTSIPTIRFTTLRTRTLWKNISHSQNLQHQDCFMQNRLIYPEFSKQQKTLFLNLTPLMSSIIFRILIAQQVIWAQQNAPLETRILKHEKDVYNPPDKWTALTKHAWHQDHTFDFDNVQVIDRSDNYRKRMIVEMTHIANNPNTINQRTDTDNLSVFYHLHLNNRFKNKWKMKKLIKISILTMKSTNHFIIFPKMTFETNFLTFFFLNFQ